MNLYYSLIYPHLIYAIQVRGLTFDTNIDKLIVLQKKTVRMMTFNRTFFSENGPPVHSDPLFKELNILKLNDIAELCIAQFVYDCIHKLAPIQFHDWFILNHNLHSHNTHSNVERVDNYINQGGTNLVNSSGSLFIPIVRTTHYGLRSLHVSGPKIWNKTPIQIRESNTHRIFSKAFRKNKISSY